jgi:hypothetical protein
MCWSYIHVKLMVQKVILFKSTHSSSALFRLVEYLKVDVPNSNRTTMWTSIFEWEVVDCRSKNEQQKDMC